MCLIFYHDRRPCQGKRDLSLAAASSPESVKTTAPIGIGPTSARSGLRIEHDPIGEPSGEITPEAGEPSERGHLCRGWGLPFLYGFVCSELQRRAKQESGEGT